MMNVDDYDTEIGTVIESTVVVMNVDDCDRRRKYSGCDEC